MDYVNIYTIICGKCLGIACTSNRFDSALLQYSSVLVFGSNPMKFPSSRQTTNVVM